MHAHRPRTILGLLAAALGAVVIGPLVQPASATTSVSTVTWAASSTAAGSTQATYTVGFTATTALAGDAGSTITLTGPAGTTFPTTSQGGCYTVTVNGAGTACNETVYSAISPGVTLPAPAVGAGDSVVVTVDGVTNGSSTGDQTLSVSTSSDPAAVASNVVAFTGATAMSSVSAAASSTSANASKVTYRWSAVLTNGITAGHSTFTFTVPSSVSLNGAAGCSGYFHVSVNGGAETFCGSALKAIGGGTVTLSSPVSSAAGSTIVASLDGASNGSTSTPQNVSIATSSDQTAVSSSIGYTPTTAVGAPTASLSTKTPNASGVVVTAGFTATNGLTPSTATEQLSTVSLYVGGAQLPPSGGCGGPYAVSVNGGAAATCGVTVTGVGSGSVSLTLPAAVHGGDHVTVVISGATLGSSPPSTVGITTTSDPTLVFAPTTVTASTAPPTITAVSLVAGDARGGTSVTISGTNLGDVTAVHFGSGLATAVTPQSSTTLRVSSPAGEPGPVLITATNTAGTSTPSAADTFTYVGPPTITSLSPATGPKAGGTHVTIHGTGLSGVQTVVSGVSPIAFAHVNDSTLTFVTRPGHDRVFVFVISPCPYSALPAGTTSCGQSDSVAFDYPSTPKKLARMVLKVAGVKPYKLDSTGPRDSLQMRRNAKGVLTYLTASLILAGHTPPSYFTNEVGFYLHVFQGHWVGSFEIVDQTHNLSFAFHETGPVVVHPDGRITGTGSGVVKKGSRRIPGRVTVQWALYPKWLG